MKRKINLLILVRWLERVNRARVLGEFKKSLTN